MSNTACAMAMLAVLIGANLQLTDAQTCGSVTFSSAAITKVQSREITVSNQIFRPNNIVSREVTLLNTTDCNENGVADTLEISMGGSFDCNANARPDECDIGFGESIDCNENSIPDECEIAAGIESDLNGNGVLDSCEFIRGDANSDGAISISDPIYVLNYLFLSGPSQCLAAMDANGNGSLTISDATYLVMFLFTTSVGPPNLPFPVCGYDPDPLGLSCTGVVACP